MVAVAVACLPIFANGYVLNRWEGIAFLVAYAGYLTWVVLDATENVSRDTYGDVVLFFVAPIITITIATLWYRGRANGTRRTSLSRLDQRWAWRATNAAPAIPALFAIAAGTIGVSIEIRGSHFSADFEAPPPTMKRSGENSISK